VSAAHTPGPWHVGRPTEYLNQLPIEPCIGVAYGAGKELVANSRLIAAAPDLLAALRRLAEAVETDDHLSLGTLTEMEQAWFLIQEVEGDDA
jgi:hypothetical protein